VGPKLWLPMGVVPPRDIAARAQCLEADGWYGMTLYDSQNLGPETFVSMTAAAVATNTLHFNVSTSNPVTRHPAVAAAAVLTLSEMVGNRVRFSVGRGDASQAYIGGAPADFRLFERYLSAVRRYLHGEPVPFEDLDDWRLTKPVSTLKVSHAPVASELRWRNPSHPPPPLDVAASGPRALSVAGRWADRVVLGLGAHVKRVAWGMEQARAARVDHGGDPDTLSFAIPVSVAVTEDLDEGRRQVSNLVATAARFALISGSVVGPTTDEEAQVYRALVESYDLSRHAGDQPRVLTDKFIDDFAIVGSPQRCVERILELHETGVEGFQLLPPMEGLVSAEEAREGYARMVEDVLPEIRKHAGPPVSDMSDEVKGEAE
jgi:5,10-methylenetetrahydromethanopterin reductase